MATAILGRGEGFVSHRKDRRDIKKAANNQPPD
jgi:hypothetical protein